MGVHTMTDTMLNGIVKDNAIGNLKEWANNTFLGEDVIVRVVEELGTIFWLTESEIAEIVAIKE